MTSPSRVRSPSLISGSVTPATTWAWVEADGGRVEIGYVEHGHVEVGVVVDDLAVEGAVAVLDLGLGHPRDHVGVGRGGWRARRDRVRRARPRRGRGCSR